MFRCLLTLVMSIIFIIPAHSVFAKNNPSGDPPAFDALPDSYLVKLAPGAVFAAGQTPFRSSAGLSQINAQVIQTTGQTQATFDSLTAYPGVLAVSPDALIRPAGDITNRVSISSFQWAPAKIRATDVWEVSSGHDVVVAILDTGIDPTHPDLKDRLVPGYNILDDNQATADGCGHGTHVAGIVAAAADNAGVVGIAYGAKLMPVKVMGDDCVGSYSRLVRGILYAVDHGARIIVITSGANVESVVLHDAVNYATRNGVLVIAAAGNQASDTPFYPAAYPEAIAVSGTDQFDGLYRRSSFGPQVDLSAPAVNIYSTYVQAHQPVYAYMSGTSMAAPHVAGLAALILAADPSLGAAAVEQLMRQHVLDLGEAGWDPFFGYGRIDALATLRAMRQVTWPPDAPPQQTVHIPLLLH